MRTLKATDNLVAVTLNRAEREFVLNAIDDLMTTISEEAELGGVARISRYGKAIATAKDLNFRLGGNADAWWFPVKKAYSGRVMPTKAPARKTRRVSR